MLTEEQTKKILEGLKQKGYCAFEATVWDSKTRSQLCEILKSEQYMVFNFYKFKNFSNRYVVVLGGSKINIADLQLEKEYSVLRDRFTTIFPLLISPVFIAVFVLFVSMDKKLMVSTIIFLVPFILGALFEYVSIKDKPQPIFQNLFKIPFFASVLIIAFTVVVLREGVICLIIMLPIVFITLMIGALAMRLICFALWKPTIKIYSIALLPVLLFLILPDFSKDFYGQTQREVIIHAPQNQVFQAINHIGIIRPEEVPSSFIFTMGFPKPVFGMTEQRAEGTVRTIEWERGVKFEETVQASHAPYLLSWNYQFRPDSFPKGSLDDHVEVGGKYFDLLKTDYQLERVDKNTTKLILTIDYRVSTEFNWYSKLWTNYILNEFSDVVMTIHKNRLEKKADTVNS